MYRRVGKPSSGWANPATALFASRIGLSYKARTRDLTFAFSKDVLNMYDHYAAIGAVDAAEKETVETLFEECGKLCTQQLFPLYQSGDVEGCKRHPVDGTVTTPKGFKEAYRSVVEGGWAGICGPREFGGLEMPQSIGVATKEMIGTANWAFLGYPGLTAGAVSTIDAWGSEVLKQAYFPKLTTGEWTGTMCMTEPHCGTDLGQCRTKAEPFLPAAAAAVSDASAADQHHHPISPYRLHGTKIFITGGDHDLAENIVHVVLAKLPDAPPGTKGLSLFLVPKFLTKFDGTLDTTRKNVNCARAESKMGMAASATCQLEFENSIGYLIGEPHSGMKAMFTFMNEARIGAAIQGVCHAELAFQNALAYARERKSLRGLSGTKEPEAVADAIIHHPNVRHNILFCKAIAEGGRLMCLDLARMVDLINTAKSDEERHKFTEEAGFYTPIAKALLTELGLEAASCGVQVFGGHGYIKGNGMEQILRDARIGTLYEGTTGVQALDFIGRKVLKSKTREPAKFAARVAAVAKPFVMKSGDIGKCSRQLMRLSLQWRFGVGALYLNAAKDKESVGSASQDVLMFAGYITLGYYWLRMAIAAQKQIDAGKDVDGFYLAKVTTCKFYFDRILPRATAHYDMMMLPATSLMKTDQTKWDM
ncbi:acyl-CoA dehydrogenase, putative [Bodo saltans]|uniref:Acyl-CoA dehydrogenase, putative n=1 Tax=Bodo saltans TaxID=75058 RepID=A0A0S4JQE6_BODSA|nr:acyl-CoA dehydrogenase, putative [Bodo saltans]|eukprot:CUG93719.1 acyl-CoA dehydrogenase, putative [Bodo saltans]